MKTIKKDSEIVRVEDKEAFEKVKKGWVFVTKSLWKKEVRDKGKTKVESKDSKKPTHKPSKNDKEEIKEVKVEKVDTRSEVDQIVEGTGESRPKNAGLEKYRAKKGRKAGK